MCIRDSTEDVQCGLIGGLLVACACWQIATGCSSAMSVLPLERPCAARSHCCFGLQPAMLAVQLHLLVRHPGVAHQGADGVALDLLVRVWERVCGHVSDDGPRPCEWACCCFLRYFCFAARLRVQCSGLCFAGPLGAAALLCPNSCTLGVGVATLAPIMFGKPLLNNALSSAHEPARQM